ncbi:MAG TPA: HipA domain-containing protein [Solirubrobacterales bacterium]|jgi:serine/threonine-protein kinase HipA|nr:HipA domain-containing protein [Solirubrobacterales bacterium]
MAPRQIEVFVQIAGEDVLAGRLWSHRRQRTESETFAYSPSYLARNGAYALDPALPLVSGQIQTPVGRAMFGAFSDCAPDRWGRMLIRRRARRAGRGGGSAAAEAFGEIDFLLGVRDDLRQGALRFRDPESEQFLANERSGVPHLVDLPRLLDLSDRAERDVASEEELEILLKGGSSLGGARPKAHVIDRLGRIAIAKFPRPEGDDWDVAAWEAIALRLARGAGLTVADSDLIDVGGRAVLIVDRFDRRGEQRVGYVSAMTMLEAVDGEARTYLDLVEVIEEESDRVTEDLRELWRRIAFSRLISNTDDHLRNHGFLRARTGGWSLSPAFGLNPNPEPGAKRFATAIDEGPEGTGLEELLAVAELFRLGRGEAEAMVSELSRATSRWREVAREHGMDAGSVAQMAPAFEHPAADLAREMASIAY